MDVIDKSRSDHGLDRKHQCLPKRLEGTSVQDVGKESTVRRVHNETMSADYELRKMPGIDRLLDRP